MAPQPSPMEQQSASWPIVRGLAAFLILSHLALVGYLAVILAPTCDESSHLAAGYRRLTAGRFDLDLGNPPLVGTIASGPLLFADVKTDWRRIHDSGDAGRDFVAANGPHFLALLSRGRLACLPFTLLGAWVCFRWSSKLYGPMARLVALSLWCFSPNILAHAPLVTGDVSATAFGLAAFYSLWKWLREPSAVRALECGCWFGAAQLTKYVWLMMYIAWPLLWVAWRCWARRLPARRAWRSEAMQLSWMLLLGIYVTNLGYLFDGSLRGLGQYRFGSRVLASLGAGRAPAERGLVSRCLAAAPVPLPEPYVRGLDEIGAWFERPHESYLRGQWSADGWWYYYLYGLAVKVPLGTWLLAIASRCWRGNGRGPAASAGDEAFLLLPIAGILWFVTATSTQQSHIRYVLPVLPFIFISASKVANIVSPRRPVASVFIASALCWSVISSLLIYPHPLSYFNELAGGPLQGHEHLIDSNIDWGQDLFELRDWLSAHPTAEPFHLAYFGGVDPQFAGISFTLPPSGPPGGARRAARHPPPGWYAVSVNFLHGLPCIVPDGTGGWQPTRGNYTYFQQYQPMAVAGYSIYIYRIGIPQPDSSIAR